jgi:N-acetylglucosamine kinase-like BadF-type ATPase
MTYYFLGADVGSTKTHVAIADETGRVLSLAEGDAGNPDTVGYEGLRRTLEIVTRSALQDADITIDQIAGAGYGVSGLDYPAQKTPTMEAIRSLGLYAPIEAVNDALIGVVAGATDGWGIGVVSGTGCNCWGWDRQRRQGQVTGSGWQMGEYAGSSELAARAVQLVAYEWTRRGPATQLTPLLLRYLGESDVVEMLHGLTSDRLHIDAAIAPLIFEVAAQGDAVAIDLIRWAGRELGELAKAVIRQLDFATLEFDVVLLGSMFNGGPLLIEPMRESIAELAPRAKLVRLQTLPVAGAVFLGMEQAHWRITSEIRARLQAELERTAVKRIE